MTTYIDPPKKCDICWRLIEEEFVDGATWMGYWSNMCTSCHQDFGRGLGTGKGQRYKKQQDGTFLKVEG
jgi:hypothetical protein